ncbi:SDR family NAD(P)-dependent oxidoreductase [Shewanella maritima]|uniref:SDR family NAD(P)-dependent oxidoreductase n=1 Tax=Shewanella maritima TaxID=2520507 RepID=UPI0037364FE1
MILITGASSGLGGAVAKQYVQSAQAITITGRNSQRLTETAESLAAIANDTDIVQAVGADLTQASDVAELFDYIDAAQQPLSTVVHCAGSGYFGDIVVQDNQQIQNLIDNNLLTTINLVRELVRRYQDKPVTVVVVMSTAALVAKAGESTYCAVKWAVKGFIESVRLELKSSPMKLVCVYPGGMDTGFWPTSGKDVDTSGFMSADEAAGMLVDALKSTQHGYVADITIQRG